MDLSSLSIMNARDLAGRINLIADKAEDLQEEFGKAPVIDITSDLRICAPLLPATDVLPALQAARSTWEAETDRLIADLTRQFAVETEALADRFGRIAIPVLPVDASRAEAPPCHAACGCGGSALPDIPPPAAAPANGDCAGGDWDSAPRAELEPPCGGMTGAEWSAAQDATDRTTDEPVQVIQFGDSNRPGAVAGIVTASATAADVVAANAPAKRANLTPKAASWSSADDAIAVGVAVRLDGESWNEIYRVAAKETGRTREGVKARIKSHLMTRIFDARDAARAAAAAPEVKATPAPTVRTAPVSAKPAPLRDDVIGNDEAEKIMRLHDQGETFNVIGAHMKRHPAAVASLIKRKVAERAGAGIDKAVADAKAAPAVAPVATPTTPMSKTVSAPAESPPAKVTFRPSIEGLTSAPHRQLRGYLNALGYKAPWSAAMDLDLVRGLVEDGRRLPEIALDLGIDTDACKKRFATLTAYARNDKGGLTIDGQSLLLAELKVRHTLIAGGAA